MSIRPARQIGSKYGSPSGVDRRSHLVLVPDPDEQPQLVSLLEEPNLARAAMRAYWAERDASVPESRNPLSSDHAVFRWIRRRTLLRPRTCAE